MNISRNIVRAYVSEFDKNMSILDIVTEDDQIAIMQNEISKMPRRRTFIVKKEGVGKVIYYLRLKY